jgi:hypothetical protein
LIHECSISNLDFTASGDEDDFETFSVDSIAKKEFPTTTFANAAYKNGEFTKKKATKRNDVVASALGSRSKKVHDSLRKHGDGSQSFGSTRRFQASSRSNDIPPSKERDAQGRRRQRKLVSSRNLCSRVGVVARRKNSERVSVESFPDSWKW